MLFWLDMIIIEKPGWKKFCAQNWATLNFGHIRGFRGFKNVKLRGVWVLGSSYLLKDLNHKSIGTYIQLLGGPRV